MTIEYLFGVVTSLAEVLRLNIADVQKPIPADTKIDERRLDARLQIDDPTPVDVSYKVVLAGSFGIQFLQNSIFQYRDPTLLGLRHIDQHFFFHCHSL
jgi:hypothetical protein